MGIGRREYDLPNRGNMPLNAGLFNQHIGPKEKVSLSSFIKKNTPTHVRVKSDMTFREVPWRRLIISIFERMMSSTVSKNSVKVILSLGSNLSMEQSRVFILSRKDL